jgi:hypothetical protein
MPKVISRALLGAAAAVSTVLAVGMLGTASPAFGATTPPSEGGVVVVDQPDTGGLNNVWTFAPAGVPVFGLVQSVSQVPVRLF